LTHPHSLDRLVGIARRRNVLVIVEAAARCGFDDLTKSPAFDAAPVYFSGGKGSRVRRPSSLGWLWIEASAAEPVDAMQQGLPPISMGASSYPGEICVSVEVKGGEKQIIARRLRQALTKGQTFP
jgi:hypothetical protein